MDSSFIFLVTALILISFPSRYFQNPWKVQQMYEQLGFTEFRRNLLVSENLQINVTAHHNAQKQAIL